MLTVRIHKPNRQHKRITCNLGTTHAPHHCAAQIPSKHLAQLASDLCQQPRKSHHIAWKLSELACWLLQHQWQSLGCSEACCQCQPPLLQNNKCPPVSASHLAPGIPADMVPNVRPSCLRSWCPECPPHDHCNVIQRNWNTANASAPTIQHAKFPTMDQGPNHCQSRKNAARRVVPLGVHQMQRDCSPGPKVRDMFLNT